MSRLLRLLLRFLILPVGEADQGSLLPDDSADPAPAPESDNLDGVADAAAALDGDVPRETAGEEPAPAPSRPSELERFERELNEERTRRRQLEDRLVAAPQAAPVRDPQWEAEERRLADARAQGMDANAIGWLQWQIGVDRQNRQTRADAARDRQRSEDALDRATFSRFETSKPALYKAYAPRVEQEIAQMRARGEQIPPREVILKFLVGNDAVDGKLKKTTAAPKPATTPAPTNQVDRGRTPGVRTDVRGRANAQSEREKRAARLRDVPL